MIKFNKTRSDFSIIKANALCLLFSQRRKRNTRGSRQKKEKMEAGHCIAQKRSSVSSESEIPQDPAPDLHLAQRAVWVILDIMFFELNLKQHCMGPSYRKQSQNALQTL